MVCEEQQIAYLDRRYQQQTTNHQQQTVLLNIVLYIAGSIVVLSILAYFIQEKLIFKPEKLKQDFVYKYDAPFEELFFDVETGVRINGRHFTVEKPLGLILYFHGYRRRIKGWA